jgi:branched-chain amino acid transport system substrate-binding protein
MRRFITVFLVSVFLVSGIIAGPVGIAQAAKPLKIGAILNLTGAVAFLGPLFRNGITMALEEENYMVGGRKIELIVEDAANDMNVVLEKAKKLVERDRVNIIIGPLMGDAHMAVKPYLAGKKVVRTVLHSGDLIQTEDKNTFIYPTTLVGLTIPLGYYAADQGYKKMVTIGADYAGGHGFIKGIKLGFEEKGGTVIQQIWAPVGTVDYGPYLTSMKEADVIGYFGETASVDQRFVAQLSEFGIKIPPLVAVADGCLPPPVLQELADKALGIKGQVTYLTDRKDPLNEAWVKKMTDRFNQTPGGMESNGYAITRTILTALKATGGDDSYDKLWPAILKVKIDTPQGPLEVSPEGVALLNGYIAEVRKDNGTYYWEAIKAYEKVADPRLKK